MGATAEFLSKITAFPRICTVEFRLYCFYDLI